jgi:GPI-anchor transamidase subunit T
VLDMVHCLVRLFVLRTLTPWLKLLPCCCKSGLASLLERPANYRGFRHSQTLGIIGSEDIEPGIVLEQTLTIVVQPDDQRTSLSYSCAKILQPDLSIGSVFGRKISGMCVIAKSVSVRSVNRKILVPH